jgi:hypothetical protein
MSSGQTENQKSVLWHLQERVWKTQQEFGQQDRQVLNHDNTPPHMALSILKFLKKTNLLRFYSHPTDLTSCWHTFFPVTKIESMFKSLPIWMSRRNTRKNVKGANPYFFKILYGKLGKLKTSLEWPRKCRGQLFQRGHYITFIIQQKHNL